MCSSQPLLQRLEVHRRQRGTRAALDTGERLQHLGEDVQKGEEGVGGGEVKRVERRGNINITKLLFKSHIIFLNVFSFLTVPWESEACGMYKVLVKPSN